jgi:hypothetical protein
VQITRSVLPLSRNIGITVWRHANSNLTVQTATAAGGKLDPMSADPLR